MGYGGGHSPLHEGERLNLNIRINEVEKDKRY